MATAELYRAFAVEEARGRSALYERLALDISSDCDLLRLLECVPLHSRQPSLLFARVQFLSEEDCPPSTELKGVPDRWHLHRVVA